MNFKKTIDKIAGNKNLLIYLIIGIILIIAGSSFIPSKDKKEPVSLSSAEKIDKKALEEILSNIDGAGKVSVFITYGDNGKKEIATDISKNITGAEKEEMDISVKTMTKQGGGQEPYVISEKNPEIKGVLVTATGAKNDNVKIRIYQSVKAATGVPLHRICVETGNK